MLWASRPTLRRPSRSTWENDIKCRPPPAYAARKAALADEQVRLSLDLVEEAIAVDPYHRFRRGEINRIVYDITDRVMVEYAMVDDEVLYLAFVDLIGR